ncbi:1,4-dihydroxy-2-naphthoate prenyltransferase [Bifidobacterium sp. DSM 109958]|uniref:1,4-dihydroxy-2-naphthoate octaprenyltransferase n=1 Tax=Bifidobacterium moraviense TaxID=2675323 RepID=A0A7Y0F1C4_9BIFI|nr:1,4-dihydroxy-2-naphthoate octaprenyltransferase [Bifidobacterium sp. DSM 109958]NMN00210.1 1,4-dihydroxy-2-naphthoate prenyltransferase [Bifidobacterium sp. DSM 109958]
MERVSAERKASSPQAPASSVMSAPAPSDGPSRPPLRLWITGLRPRTLPASIAPVAVGAAAAWTRIGAVPGCPEVYPQPAYCAADLARHQLLVSRFWPVALLCAAVALFLQIAVNFANDYSDGIRGTDAARTADERSTGKPRRLTASGLVRPRAVLAAAGLAAAVACAAGLAATAVSGQWWLPLIGAAGLLAGWTYTGGRHPYGYAGFGELGVFLFFGLAAVLGTESALAGEVTLLGLAGAVVSGLLACAMLMVNNLRDVDDDRVHGKRTLAVRLGERRARRLLIGVHAVAVLPVAVLAVVPLGASLRRWAGLECGAAQSVPPCPGGSAACSTEPVASVVCSPSVPPSVAVALLGLAGAALLTVGVAFVRAVRRRDFGGALALSGLSALVFAAVAVIGAVATVPGL